MLCCCCIDKRRNPSCSCRKQIIDKLSESNFATKINLCSKCIELHLTGVKKKLYVLPPLTPGDDSLSSACPTSVTWEDQHQLVARAKILVLGKFDPFFDLVLIMNSAQIWGFLASMFFLM